MYSISRVMRVLHSQAQPPVVISFRSIQPESKNDNGVSRTNFFVGWDPAYDNDETE